jgi:hypothetical protein
VRKPPRRDLDDVLWTGRDSEAILGVVNEPAVDLAPLKGVLADLVACRQLLESVFKDG